MVKILKNLLFFSILMLLPISCKALECDFTEKARLKSLASNINTSYIPVENGNTITFNVTISNIYPGLIVVDATTGNQYYYDENRQNPGEVVITGLNPDKTYRYEIYSTNEECNDSSLNIYYVTLPAYNSYYKDPICDGLSDYKLCNKWLKTDMSYEEFIKEVTDYKNSLNQPDKTETKDNGELNPILEFIYQYYYIFIALFVIAIIYIIYVRRKRDSFGF